VRLDVPLPEAADGLHAFVADEPRLGELARGVIDRGKQAAALRPTFEPGFIGTVELFQFPVRSLTLSPGMVDALHLTRLGMPQTLLDHDLPDTFGRERNLVVCGELLARKRRFEVRVPGFQDLKDALDGLLAKPPVRPFPAAGVRESPRTVALDLSLQAPHLPGGQAQLLRGFRSVYFLRKELLQNGIPGKLSHGERDGLMHGVLRKI